ncbi:14411_t:CDS:2 [Cetraspora pellucida]|uniref:14411_t:CDS:1 n=1 Tax=Cetraspora pellucida TaxID=1433469 RepID=A0A9N8VCV5_9GLOM|nr:14411_t:CDS:2 [Cetraspora pellucida]
MQETKGSENSSHSQASCPVRQVECNSRSSLSSKTLFTSLAQGQKHSIKMQRMKYNGDIINKEQGAIGCCSKRSGDLWIIKRENKTKTHQLPGTSSKWNCLNSNKSFSRDNMVAMSQTASEAENLQEDFQLNSRNLRPKRPHYFCQLQKPPHSKLHFLEIRPKSLSHRCTSGPIEGLEYLGKSSIGSPTQNTTQSLSEKAIELYTAAYDKDASKTFFDDQLKAGKTYNTIARYRSAISEVHDWIDNSSVRSYPTIIMVMKGVYNTNSPPPQNDNIVNLIPLFDKIYSFGNNEEMNILLLLQKVTFLLAITTACRPSDLVCIDITSQVQTEHGMMLNIKNPKEHKISIAYGGNKPQTKRIYIENYEELPEISPLNTVNTLIRHTEVWRTTKEQKEHLFLILTNAHTPASVDTIAKWVKEILREASPDLKAKDARSLAAFYTQNSGADLTTILTMGN